MNIIGACATGTSPSPPTAMAENIYSKGTQVWFPDKELSWISGEVASATRNADDSVKLVFLDERGKVCIASDCVAHFKCAL